MHRRTHRLPHGPDNWGHVATCPSTSLSLWAWTSSTTTTSPSRRRSFQLASCWKLRAAGASAAKIVLYYDPDSSDASARCSIVAEVVKRCHDVGLPLLVEPLPIPTTAFGRSASVARRRGRRHVSATGADILKLPLTLDTETARIAQEITRSAARTPWILLSSGVPYDEFLQTLSIALDGGAAGFAAGRSIWNDLIVDVTDEAVGARSFATSPGGRETDWVNWGGRRHMNSEPKQSMKTQSSLSPQVADSTRRRVERLGNEAVPLSRLRVVEERLRQNGEVLVANLAREFGVSEVTIRRDLTTLEERGVAQRSHGGAILVDSSFFRPAIHRKQTSPAGREAKNRPPMRRAPSTIRAACSCAVAPRRVKS